MVKYQVFNFNSSKNFFIIDVRKNIVKNESDHIAKMG